MSALCSTCETIGGQDPLQVKTLEIEQTLHNSCAPITHFTCRCRTCGTRWLAMEIYDEDTLRMTVDEAKELANKKTRPFPVEEVMPLHKNMDLKDFALRHSKLMELEEKQLYDKAY